VRIERRFVVHVLSCPKAQAWATSYREWWNVAEFVKVVAPGFEFTAQDYENAVNKVLSEKHAAGALKDAELELRGACSVVAQTPTWDSTPVEVASAMMTCQSSLAGSNVGLPAAQRSLS
jgi:hypothetical protein